MVYNIDWNGGRIKGMKEKKKVPKTSWKKKDFLGWMIMLPSIILFAFFVWEPLIESVRLSLYTAKGIHTEDFVGLIII